MGGRKTYVEDLGSPLKPTQRCWLISFQPVHHLPRTRKKFDPTDECIVAGQHRRKKSASQLKGRSKQITVVLLSNIPSSIPKGAAREQLKKKGKVREVPFQRYMSEEEVKEVLVENFECLSDSEVQFLQSHKAIHY